MCTPQPANKPAELQVGIVTFTPSKVMANDSVTVAASITNVGGITGTYTAVLTVDSKEVGRKDVSVDPGQSQKVSFQIPTAAAGEYEVAIGSSNASMKVWTWAPYTIKYDSGIVDQGTGHCAYGEFGHMVHFSPPATPFRIQKIMVCGWKECTYQNDCAAKNLVVRIWNKDSSQTLWAQEFPWSLFDRDVAAWKELNVPNVPANNDYYVEIVTHSELLQYEDGKPISTDLRLCASVGGSDSSRSSYSLNGKVISQATRAWLIRVQGEGAPY